MLNSSYRNVPFAFAHPVSCLILILVYIGVVSSINSLTSGKNLTYIPTRRGRSTPRCSTAPRETQPKQPPPAAAAARAPPCLP